MRLVSEFLAKQYPNFETRTRVRLGAIHPELHPETLSESEKAMVGVFRRWADAIVIMPDRLVLIEAAIRPSPGDISQIELYEHLLPLTPELEKFRSLPVDKLLVYALEDPVIVTMARERGIKCTFFKPPWVDDYLSILYPRERRAPLT